MKNGMMEAVTDFEKDVIYIMSPVVKCEMERNAVKAIFEASHKFIDDVMEVLGSDSTDDIKNDIEIVYLPLFEVIRGVKIAIHPTIYKEIYEFKTNVFEGLFSNKPILDSLETVTDWISAVQNLRNYFEEFTDEVLMPYLWG